MWISVIKMATFLLCALIFLSFNNVLLEPKSLFNKFSESFGEHAYNVSEIKDQVLGEEYGQDNVYQSRCGVRSKVFFVILFFIFFVILFITRPFPEFSMLSCSI